MHPLLSRNSKGLLPFPTTTIKSSLFRSVLPTTSVEESHKNGSSHTSAFAPLTWTTGIKQPFRHELSTTSASIFDETCDKVELKL